MQRFWDKTEPGENGCIMWSGQTTTRGDYGKFWYQGKADRAHIVSFMLVNEYRPPVVRHTCDVSLCVSPSHLIPGTVADNNRDMVERGRYNLSGLALGPKVSAEKAKLKDCCSNGHKLVGDNVVTRKTGRIECRTCKNALSLKRYHERKKKIMIEGTEKNFNELVSNGTVLVDYFAVWCGPCKMLAPTLQKIEDEHGLKIVKIDVDENTELARRYQVMSIPTMILFKDGEPVKTIVGVKSKAALEKDFGLTA